MRTRPRLAPLAPVLGPALVLGLVSAPAAAQRTAAPRVPFDTFTLANGLRVIVHEDRSTPIVAVNVWYDVGSAHEPPGRSGFAHLFEHMLFQETENLEKGEFDRLLDEAGGQNNGTTNQDRTAYFEWLPSNRVNLALWLEAERMARLRVTPENFAREREVVKEERRLRVDNQPYGVAFLTLDTLASHWPPYRHTVIGSMDDLNAATADDVLDFYRRYYVPNNATVVVAGAVSTAQVRALAEEYFGAIPRGPEKPPLPPIPPTPRTDGERRATLEDRLANTPLFLAAFNIPPHRHPDTRALDLLAAILSRGQSSRLFQRLVKDERAALNVFVYLDSRVGPGLLVVQAIPNQGVELARIEALVWEELEKVKTGGVTARELEKAKNQIRASQILGRQTVFGKSQAFHHYRLYHGATAEIDTDLDHYAAVTAEEIQRVARTYLVPANRTVLHVRPAPRPAASGPDTPAR